MKKILFTANTMCFGGIERALINLLKNIDYSKYEVSLILQKKEGDFLSEIPSQVNVSEYRISESKNVLFRKIYNRLKLIFTKLKLKNKYDFSACFATYSIPSSLLALSSSKNSAIWIHNDYYYMYNQNKNEVDKFFSSIKVSSYKRIIFVANESKDNFVNLYPNLLDKTRVCNNFIDYKRIQELSNEDVLENKTKKIFLNISRHDEVQKKLIRLIDATRLLLKERDDFEVWMIGDGPDRKKYDDLIQQNGLNNVIKMLGKKINPYPYYKMADAFVMTSDFEGFPVVYVESCIFNLPLITTIDVTDEYLDVKKYGILVEKDSNKIYEAMNNFLDNGFKQKEKFDPKVFNEIIKKKIDDYISDKD